MHSCESYILCDASKFTKGISKPFLQALRERGSGADASGEGQRRRDPDAVFGNGEEEDGEGDPLLNVLGW